MYLKAIDVQGFKSFANRMHFDFGPGVTCIVGPNGSGKSNVADAVRWVLGEQSAKQLRGSNMQDVIFAGTENRKPLGFASVTLTLDNRDHSINIDYEEVIITRKLYRSGESEYRLNGASCRLKDIYELFYDTGVGKEGYSIIGQGQIDRILSNRPEERRELFDEAAGIVKFKKRKNVAVKKLQEEQQNLTRVNDILQELERQVVPLQKQSQTAEKYLELKNELRDYDINVFLRERETGEAEVEELEKSLEELSRQQEQKQQENETLRQSYTQTEQKISQIQQEMDEKQVVYNQSLLDVQAIKGDIQVLTEQINTEYASREHIENRIRQIDKDNVARKEELLRLSEERENLSDELKQTRRSFSASQTALDDSSEQIAKMSDEIEAKKAKIIELLNIKSTYSAEFQRYETILEQNKKRQRQLEEWLEKSYREQQGKQSVWQESEKETEQLQCNQISLQEETDYVKKVIGQTESEIREKERSLQMLRQYYHQTFSRAETLRNLAERYDGYGNSVRRVMELKSSRAGIYGVVADIIGVEKKYEVAVETALGGSIQNIVTDTEQTAKQLIQFLKRNQFGRATFLPLEAMRGNNQLSNLAILKESGIIGVASELVKTDEKFVNLIQFLLGRVVVAENIDLALNVARKYHYSYRIVTLDGDLFTPGGAMTGGAYKSSSNLLGRKREIEELEQTIAIQAKNCREGEQELQRKKDVLEESKGHLEEIHRQQQELQVKLVENELRKKQLKQELATAAEGEEDWKLELNQLKNQSSSLEQQRSRTNDSIDAIEAKNSATENLLMEMSRSLEEKKNKEKQIRIEYNELQIKSTALQRQDTYLLDNMTRIRNEREKFYQEKKKLQVQLEDSEDIEAEKEEEIQSMKDKQKQLEQNVRALETEIRTLRQNKEELNVRQSSFFQKREVLNQELTDLDKNLFRLKSKTERLEERLDHQTEYLWNEYEIGPNEAEQYYREDLGDLQQLREKCAAIQNRMKRLGHINLESIEQCRELVERYDFMKTQYNDLMSSVQSMRKIVTDLDQGMRKQFREKFNQIQIEFNQVFQELFGGGQASLEISEDEDEIEAGIRIIAQPPGKKLQNMMQLSGGEKALTAIALLFAIQRLKPSPFCLLDEIEAALDDSNVGRFAEYLHRLTSSTQFIIITHKRDTMASADRLYGITMQEKGISALVSVNLIDNLD
ncbi:MAG: chromosome segregation protein SMC [Lachnospiraceae bacterium]